MICLDASVLIAHFNPDDAHHDRARRLLAARAANQFCASALTLAEFLVQPARISERAVQRAVDGIRELQITSVPVDDPERLALLRAELGLKMPDCCVLDAAMAMGALVASFDAALLAAAESAGCAVAAEG